MHSKLLTISKRTKLHGYRNIMTFLKKIIAEIFLSFLAIPLKSYLL